MNRLLWGRQSIIRIVGGEEKTYLQEWRRNGMNYDGEVILKVTDGGVVENSVDALIDTLRRVGMKDG